MNKYHKGAEKAINMYNIIPRPRVDFRTESDGSITLLKPKFQNPLLVKYLLPQIKRKHFKIHLDEIGTAVWKLCNGTNSAGFIAEKINQEFGDKVKPAFDRVGKFLRQLQTAKLIELKNESAS
jgi:hypothetical protein